MFRLSFLVLLTLQTCVLCDDECDKRNVSGIEGGDVTLQVDHTGVIMLINWIYVPKGTLIITTRPGKPIDDKEVFQRYRGRVTSTETGSLQITHLTQEDQRIYGADIRTDGEPKCLHFILTLYKKLSAGDIQISHNVTRNDTCSVVLTCTVTGSDRDVTITWRSLNSSDISVTGDVLYVPPRDITITYICTASNPASSASAAVVPQEICGGGGGSKQDPYPDSGFGRNYTIIIISTSLVIIVIIIIVLIIKNTKPKPNPAKNHTKVDKQKKPTLTPNDPSVKQPLTTNTVLYSKADHVQENNSGNKLKDQVILESVYSVATNPKENPRDGKQNGTSAQKEVDSLYSTINNPAQNNSEKFQVPVESVYSLITDPKDTLSADRKQNDASAISSLYSTVNHPVAPKPKVLRK